MAPLQLYCSGLVFAPAQSIVRKNFHDEISKHIKTLPAVEDSWSSVLQTLEGHSDSVNSVAFFPDGCTLASGSFDKTVKLWDVTTGTLHQTLEGHSSSVSSVLNKPNSNSQPQISLSNTYIALGGENILRLPAEYHGFTCCAIEDATLALGLNNGQVTIIEFHT